jgi:hypothetical protein
VTDGHARLAALTQNIREEQETIRVLKAEWSYLNQPARLEKLSDAYLKLQPLAGKQMIEVKDLQDRPAPPDPVAIATAEAVPPPAAAQTLQTAPKPPEQAKPESMLQAARARPVAAVPAGSKPAPKPLPIPAALPVAAHAPARTPAPPRPVAEDRSFGDVMKSLGAAGTDRGAY